MDYVEFSTSTSNLHLKIGLTIIKNTCVIAGPHCSARTKRFGSRGWSE